MAKAADIADMQKRAFAWVRKPDGSILARDSALGEENLALDVLDLVDEVVDLRQSLEMTTGPHCSSCGNPIDPDYCHCGSAIKSHGWDDGHHAVPMGCVCGYADPDWKALAKSRGEFAWKQRRRSADLEAALEEACRLGRHFAELECDSAGEDRFDELAKLAAKGAAS